MRIKHISEIATALLMARWKQSLIAAVGVAFSIALFISLLGFMEGLNKLLDGIMMNRIPHVRLYNDLRPSYQQPIEMDEMYREHYHVIHSIKPTNAREEIRNSEKILENLSKDDRILGVSPKVTAQVFYNLGNINLNGIIHGIDVDQETKLFFFGDYVLGGNERDVKNITNSIILGKGAADNMLAKVGDNIQVTTTEGEQFSLKVVDIFQSGIAEIDKVQSYASIATTQKLLGKNKNYISEIQIKIKDVDQAPQLAKEYEKLYHLDAEDFQTANAQFETGSDVRSIISYAVGITLLVVSGFGIYNILNMLIYEKLDTIAILKATGFDGSDVKHIFIVISMSIGLTGALSGTIMGYGLSAMIDSIPFNTASLPTVTTYPIDYGMEYYSIAIIFALITTYLAGWFPARKASKIDPVIIIRGK